VEKRVLCFSFAVKGVWVGIYVHAVRGGRKSTNLLGLWAIFYFFSLFSFFPWFSVTLALGCCWLV
jgi:hypothetical protein